MASFEWSNKKLAVVIMLVGLVSAGGAGLPTILNNTAEFLSPKTEGAEIGKLRDEVDGVKAKVKEFEIRAEGDRRKLEEIAHDVKAISASVSKMEGYLAKQSGNGVAGGRGAGGSIGLSPD